MKVTRLGPAQPILTSGLGLNAGARIPGGGNDLQVLTSNGSNGRYWGENVRRITSNGSNTLLSPDVNFANGSGITFAVSSNTLTVSGIGGGSSTFVGARAVDADAQIIATGTWTALVFNDADTFDTDAYHDTATNNSRMTVPTGRTGKYRVTGWCYYNESNSTGDRFIAIAKNGTRIANSVDKAGGDQSCLADDTVECAVVGDYLEIHTHQDSGGDRTVTGRYFVVEYLGA